MGCGSDVELPAEKKLIKEHHVQIEYNKLTIYILFPLPIKQFCHFPEKDDKMPENITTAKYLLSFLTTVLKTTESDYCGH